MSVDGTVTGEYTSQEAIGGANYIQARILHDLKLYLLKKPNSKLNCLNAIPKERRAKAWRLAHSFILLYLDSYQMNMTTAMVRTERKRETHVEKSFLKGATPSKYIMDIMKSYRRKPRFRARVEEFQKMMAKMPSVPRPRVSLNFDFEVVKAGTRKNPEVPEASISERTESFADESWVSE